MSNEAAKIELVRELFDLPTMLLEVHIDLAEQSLKELQQIPPNECEADKQLREALTEAAELTLVICYALTNPEHTQQQMMDIAKAKCAMMGINAFGILDDGSYDPKVALTEDGFHLQ